MAPLGPRELAHALDRADAAGLVGVELRLGLARALDHLVQHHARGPVLAVPLHELGVLLRPNVEHVVHVPDLGQLRGVVTPHDEVEVVGEERLPGAEDALVAEDALHLGEAVGEADVVAGDHVRAVDDGGELVRQVERGLAVAGEEALEGHLAEVAARELLVGVQARGHDGLYVMVEEGLDDLLGPLRVEARHQHVVIVQKDQAGAVDKLEALVAVAADAVVGVGLHVHPGVAPLVVAGDLEGLVGGAVVEYQDLEVPAGLPQHRVQRVREVLLPVVDREHDGEEGLCGHRRPRFARASCWGRV